MGKVRTRILGMEDVEEEQKKKQKEKAKEKALLDKKGQGSKGKGEAEKREKGASPKDSLSSPAPTGDLDSRLRGNDSDNDLNDTSEELKKEKKAQKKQATKARVRGKKYQAALKIRSEHAGKGVALKEALELLKKIKYAAFDESVEIHANLVKEGLRGEVTLPHSTGKQVKVAIVDEAILEAIGKGKVEFDILISHPSFMPKLARYAKILGPRGLMPSPKVGTISDKPEEAAKKFTSGMIRWKSEAKFPLIHLLVGKISYDEKKLLENISAYIAAIGKENIQSVWIKTTMSPSVALDLEKLA